MKSFCLIILAFLCCGAKAQPGYTVNDETGDFAIRNILNYSSSATTFKNLKNRLLVIDFFGTWCAPCVKALPHLAMLQEKFKDQVNVVLVSEEPRDKLESFIIKRQSFTFPLVVDEEKQFVSLFQPPAYPYTVIVGKNNRVLAIPSQQELTESNIDKWLKEQEMNEPPGTGKMETGNSTVNPENYSNGTKRSMNSLIRLSQDFSYAAKTRVETEQFITALRQLRMSDLENQLSTDDEKKAFWINLYNAYTQVALHDNPDQYERRGKFFGGKDFTVAGSSFSLDDIEHGILRRSKIKWSLGYLGKLFPSKTEKRLRVDTLDYRLHFALNCGAKSCPPIAFYQSENINQQLDLATKAYLQSEATYDSVNNVVKLPAIMNWFRRDFGGKKGMIKLLQQLSIVPTGKQPKIKFNKYDWTLYLQNYKS